MMKKFSAILLAMVLALVTMTARTARAQLEDPFGLEFNGAQDAPSDANSAASYYSGKEKYFKIFTRANKKNGGVDFYANNSGHCKYQFEIYFTELVNAETTHKMPYYDVIGASGKDVFLFSLAAKNKGRYSYKYKYKFHIGDPGAVKPDQSYKYLIPFEEGFGVKIQQGYNGEFSHSGWMQYSIDFPVPVGTKICAAREGTVVVIKSDSNTSGKTREFMQHGNFIIIAHDDGTFAEYVHLKQGGNLVKPGDEVEAGDPIGLSGNTGYSTSPHLHFMVVKPQRIGLWSIPVKFLGEGGAAIELVKGNKYSACR